MENQRKTIKRIKTFAAWAATFNMIGLLAAVVVVVQNKAALAAVFEALVMFYLLLQIIACCDALMEAPLFSPVITGYFRKVSYACFISGIGSTCIQTIVNSIEHKKFMLTLDLTMIGVGLLIYVGAYIYEFGCEMKQEAEFTI
ncbi:MAG: DUF2975 domain-containing protein [bacterium]|nr:DUF2975 domain-containing protein [bacterium]